MTPRKPEGLMTTSNLRRENRAKIKADTIPNTVHTGGRKMRGPHALVGSPPTKNTPDTINTAQRNALPRMRAPRRFLGRFSYRYAAIAPPPSRMNQGKNGQYCVPLSLPTRMMIPYESLAVPHRPLNSGVA